MSNFNQKLLIDVFNFDDVLQMNFCPENAPYVLETYIITEGIARGDYVTFQRFLEQCRTDGFEQ